ncbi:MAG TPA: ATP-binding protein, partial [Sedimentisphaerales bacterium]|nr:ATP-binding protein [Sedimentisphaerales bacterium]
IEEAIANLLFNAVRYTPEKGTVRLCAKDQPDCVLLEVSDTGIGIPENELTNIFEEFYRASNAKKVERDGTGLGLSIARQVVQRHGGRIWARNNQDGGSTFSITLPKISQETPKKQDNF